MQMLPLEWQDPKVWGSMVKSESKHPWNTYCSKSQLIDVNNDGLMDVFCNIGVPHHRMLNHFLINKGNMQFDFVKPEDVTEWVTWVEDAISKETKGPDGDLCPLLFLVQSIEHF